jgi:hypothetical protein
MQNVSQLSDYRNRETLELLESLLKRAKTGELTGLVFSASLPAGRQTMGWSGPFKRSPELALTACANLSERIGEHLPSAPSEDADWRPTLTSGNDATLRYRKSR